MPAIERSSYGTGDQTWLGGTHGIYNCRSGSLDVSAFTPSTHYPDGYLKSGLPLAKRTADDQYVPYAAGGSGGAGTLAGFLYTDQRVHGTEDVNAPVLMHGQINVDYLPVSGFTIPAGASQFIFVGQGA